MIKSWPGECGEWIRKHNWAEHPLGPLEQWPHALLLALASALRSAAPKLLFWGEGHLTFYNDSFVALARDFKIAELGHPASDFSEDIWLALQEPLAEGLRGVGGQSLHVRLSDDVDASGPCFCLSLTPLYGLDDLPGGVLADAENCTRGRRSTDGVLVEHRSLMFLLADAPIILAYGTGENFRIEFANRAFRDLLGEPGQDESPPDELLVVPLQHRFRQMIQQAFSCGSACAAERIEITTEAPEGGTTRIRYVDLHCQPIIDSYGQGVGVLCTGVDVTDKILAQNESDRLRHQVLHASRINAMGTMAMTLAHELSQPLAAAVNYAGASSKLMDSTDPAKREYGQAMLGRSIQQIHRAGEIIRRMRSIIRSGAANRGPVSVARAAAHAWQLLAPGNPEVNLSQDISEDAGIVLADQVQLEQILLNLFRNAVDASQDSPKKQIELTARRSGKRKLCISVRDHGCGLPHTWPEDFLSAALPEDPTGLGIGLLLSRTLVVANGGTLSACNAEGVGAVFNIELDVVD